MRRFLVLAPAVACLAWIPPAAAEVGPTLHNEVLSQHVGLEGPITTPSCEDTGTTPMSLTFEAGAQSLATGPIPGTFSLGAVSADVGPPETVQSMGLFPDGFDPGQGPDDFLPARPLQELLGAFDIEPSPPSPVVLVEVDVAIASSGLGACELLDGSGPLMANGYYQDVRAFGGTYEAVFYLANAEYLDFGTMDLQGRQGLICAGVVPDFAAGTCPPGTLLSETNDLAVRFRSERDTDEDGLIDALDACPEQAASSANGCPTTAPPPPPPPPPPPAGPVGEPGGGTTEPPDGIDPVMSGKPKSSLRKSTLRLGLGTFSEDVTGRVTLTSGPLASSAQKGKKPRLNLSKSFKATAGKPVTVSFKLTAKLLAAVKRQRRVKLTAKVVARDAAGNTTSRTLKLTLRP